MRSFPLSLSILFLLCITPPSGGAEKYGKEKSAYSYVEISAFDVKENVEVPEDFLERLRKDLPQRLIETRKFKQVFNDGRVPKDQNAPTLRMTGTIIEFNAGNRAVRYLVGFGAGASKLVADVKFTDTATGHLIFERDVTGKISKGMYGESSSGIADQMAKEIARVVKRESF